MPGAAPPLPQSVVFNTFASYAFPVVAASPVPIPLVRSARAPRREI